MDVSEVFNAKRKAIKSTYRRAAIRRCGFQEDIRIRFISRNGLLFSKYVGLAEFNKRTELRVNL
jgi:hypothetical protein